MTKRILFYLLVCSFSLVFTACDKDDPEIEEPQEVITTLTYTLIPSNGGATVELSFQDLDGDNGNDPIITGGTLAANESYEGTLVLLNETETPVGDITEEIEEEDEEHQFFFQSTVSSIAVAYNDEDEDGNPLGLSSTLTTGDAASGSLTIVLRHLPMKSASGVSAGDITNADGETDIEVTFSIDVQ